MSFVEHLCSFCAGPEGRPGAGSCVKHGPHASPARLRGAKAHTTRAPDRSLDAATACLAWLAAVPSRVAGEQVHGGH